MLLAVEDRTTLSYSHEASRELGPVGNKRKSNVGGYLAHSVLLLDAANDATVDLIDQTLWARNGAAHGQKHQRNPRAYQAKESAQWQQASERVHQRLGAATARTISICDRESDDYEYPAYKKSQPQRFVVRASRNRQTATGQQLFESLDAHAPRLEGRTVPIAQRGGRLYDDNYSGRSDDNYFGR